jgi:hypothetical protein
MNKKEYMEFHEAFTTKMLEIARAKNADYTGSSSDPFANFRAVEDIGICSTEVGFLTRMMDKFKRITSFVQQGVLQVKDESVEDTLMDLANYCILMAGFIKSKKAESLGMTSAEVLGPKGYFKPLNFNDLQKYLVKEPAEKVDVKV